MLSVQWQAVCNSMGVAIGAFVGNVGFLTFESEDFCNSYVRPFFNLPRQDFGIINLKRKLSRLLLLPT